MIASAGRGSSARRGSSAAAAVIGSGPNGLAAAVTLARAGVPVTVYEAETTPGGGTRTEELVAPGVLHDVCSAIHPMALASPFFQAFELERRVAFTVPEASYGHPLDPGDGRGGVAYRDLDRTAEELGRDGAAYRRFFGPLLRQLDGVVDAAFGGAMLRVPSSPLGLTALGVRVLEQARPLGAARFREGTAPAMLAGVAAHSIARIPSLASAAVGTVLASLAHRGGWPVPHGGSRRIANAMITDIEAHGGSVVTGQRIDSLAELRERGEHGAVLFDTSPSALAEIAGEALPPRYRRRLRAFAPGNGVCKVDLILDGPIPWRDPRFHDTPTLHLGGTREQIAAAENAVMRGEHPERPYVLLAQPTSFDPDRNAPGVHAVWSYAHVPAGSSRDMSEAVLDQIERFAPGTRDRIVAINVIPADRMRNHNVNYVGGDIAGGAVTLRQLLARPTAGPNPWQTPTPGIYLASSSTPPGPGVHGLPGWYAAQHALRAVYGLSSPALGLGGSPGSAGTPAG